MEAIGRCKKKVYILGILVIQTTLFAMIFSSVYNDNLLIVAQIQDNGIDATNSSQSNQTKESNANGLDLDISDNFEIEGIITPDTDNSAVQRGGLISNQNMSSISDSTTSSPDKILDGTWKLVVVNGNVEYFKSNLTRVTSIGTDLHDHLIEFQSDDPDILLLSNNTAVISPDPATVEIAALNFSKMNTFHSDKNITSLSRTDGTVAFSGISDIQTNGVTEWRQIPTSVSIFNGSIINVKLDTKNVNSHFLKTPINGSVSSIEPIVIIQNITG